MNKKDVVTQRTVRRILERRIDELENTNKVERINEHDSNTLRIKADEIQIIRGITLLIIQKIDEKSTITH